MTAQINLTRINENTKEVFECDLKIKLKEYKFDTVGKISLLLMKDTKNFFDSELSEIRKEISEIELDNLLSEIKNFILIKWELHKQGKEKLNSDLEFLIKDITNLKN